MRDMRIETAAAAAAGGQLGHLSQLRQLSHIATIILVLISPINSGLRSYHLSIDLSIDPLQRMLPTCHTRRLHNVQLGLCLWATVAPPPLTQCTTWKGSLVSGHLASFSFSPCTAFPGRDKPFFFWYFFRLFCFRLSQRGVVRFAAFFGSSPV